MRHINSTAFVALWSSLLFFGGCGPELEELSAQPLDRFPVGEVYWLPKAPEGAQWEITQTSGRNTLVEGDDGWTRFTPDAVGQYTFSLNGASGKRTIEAIDATEIPFHNLNYVPSRSLAMSDDTLLVAEAYTPRLARVDTDDGQVIDEIPVGPWPVSVAVTPDNAWAIVAHAGNDTLGFVDLQAGRMIDSLWVGDAPAEVVIDAAGSYAYVSLRTQAEVAQVDLSTRSVTQRYSVMPDPRSLALSSDGSTLYVAGHRTGAPERYPFGTDPIEEEQDIMVVDTGSSTVETLIGNVGSVLTDLLLDETNNWLYVAQTASYPERGLVTPEAPPFESQVLVIDLNSRTILRQTTLTPSAEGEGYVLGIQGMSKVGNALWVVAEGSELAIGLDATTLEEGSRIPINGAPRAILASEEGGAWVHASQAFEVQYVFNGESKGTYTVGTDPRPAELAAGQLHFVRPGQGYGANFSCNSCHIEGVGDTRNWPAGPLRLWETSRPMMWLEGTAPLGWGAYVADVRTFGYTGFTSIINKWPDAVDSEELGAYLSSLMPPPKANGWTHRDGSLSEAALRGKELYEGKAKCASCHALPLTTSNATFEEGITPDRSSTPVLVGSYRHNVWLKTADARTLRDAIQAALDWTDVTDLSETELDDLTRYVEELTDRDFFVLQFSPTFNRELIGADTPIQLIFNQPVWPGEKNLKRIRLVKASGGTVKATMTVDGRYLSITPEEPLDYDQDYRVEIKAGLEAYDQRAFYEAVSFDFTTAAAPDLHFSGGYTFTAQTPGFDPSSGTFDESLSIAMNSAVEATPNRDGSDLVVDLGKGLTWDTQAVINGSTFEIRDMPVSFGFSLAQGSELIGTASDVDGDGIIDAASGTFVISGPGIQWEDRGWSIVRDPEEACPQGPAGDVSVDVTLSESGQPIITFDGSEALGLYVTDYGAKLPMGPGTTVAGGAAYWVIGTEAFPSGFTGPVEYGVLPEGAVDQSEDNGATAGGVELVSEQCYQFSVTNTSFKTGSFTLIY